MRTTKLIALALAVIGTGAPAEAQRTRVTIAKGLVILTMPRGWRKIEESSEQLIVGPGREDRLVTQHAMDFCTLESKPILWPQLGKQKTVNDEYASMTAKDIHTRGNEKVIEFSTSTQVDGVRIARAIVRYDNLDMHMAYFKVIGANSAAEIRISCNNGLTKSKDEDSIRRFNEAREADREDIEKFLGSIRINH